MISTDLFVFYGVDGGSFSEQNVSFFLEFGELPFDKRIIIRVDTGCDKRSVKVAEHSESLQILLSIRWEIMAPEYWVSELFN